MARNHTTGGDSAKKTHKERMNTKPMHDGHAPFPFPCLGKSQRWGFVMVQSVASAIFVFQYTSKIALRCGWSNES